MARALVVGIHRAWLQCSVRRSISIKHMANREMAALLASHWLHQEVVVCCMDVVLQFKVAGKELATTGAQQCVRWRPLVEHLK